MNLKLRSLYSLIYKLRILITIWGFPGGSDSKESAKKKKNPAKQETRVQSLGRQDPLEKGMATHSSTFARKTPWKEVPGGLWSIGS